MLNDDESSILVTVRDGLLPKLPSGEILVRETQNFVEDRR